MGARHALRCNRDSWLRTPSKWACIAEAAAALSPAVRRCRCRGAADHVRRGLVGRAEVVAQLVVDVPEGAEQLADQRIAERAVEQVVEEPVGLRRHVADLGLGLHPGHHVGDRRQVGLPVPVDEPLDQAALQDLADLDEVAEVASAVALVLKA